MISYKTGVKSFGESVGRMQSAGQTRSAGARQWQNKMGDTPVGDYLNQVSDPNWIDPSKKIKTAGSDKMDRDAFFKLMIEQMKRQDPTNPLKSHEMAAQLAQFSSIEQLSNINQTLGELKNQQDPVAQFQALQFIGKQVAGDSSILSRFEGDTRHDFQFDLPKAASQVQIAVRNSKGETVRTYDLKNVKKGKNEIGWNGLNENGLAAPAGEYRFSVEAKDSQGKRIVTSSDFSGKITGVNFTKEGAVLMIGNKSVKLADVKTIVDPNIQSNDQKVAKLSGLDLQSQKGVAENEKVAKAPAAASKGNLDSVMMTGDMLNKLDKELSKSGK